MGATDLSANTTTTSPGLTGRKAIRATRVLVALLLFTLLLTPGSVGAQDTPQRLAEFPDVVRSSIQLSQLKYPPGGTNIPNSVVIGRSDNFADNLAGAGLTSFGVLLLHPPAAAGPPDDRVLSEVRRLGFGTDSCEEDSFRRVYLLGGTAALGSDLEEAIGSCATRFAGSERNETAALIATRIAEQFADVSPRTQVYIARNDNPADSASVAAITASGAVPLLVTPSGSLAPQIPAFLDAHPSVRTAIILGGEAAISAAVEREIAAHVETVERVAGPTRDDTAVEIMRRHDPAPSRVGIVDGYGPDAWAFAITAGASEAVDVLVYANPGLQDGAGGLDDTVVAYLQDANEGAEVVGFGPQETLSDAVLEQAVTIVGGPVGETFDDGFSYVQRGEVEYPVLTACTLLDPQFESPPEYYLEYDDPELGRSTLAVLPTDSNQADVVIEPGDGTPDFTGGTPWTPKKEAFFIDDAVVMQPDGDSLSFSVRQSTGNVPEC